MNRIIFVFLSVVVIVVFISSCGIQEGSDGDSNSVSTKSTVLTSVSEQLQQVVASSTVPFVITSSTTASTATTNVTIKTTKTTQENRSKLTYEKEQKGIGVFSLENITREELEKRVASIGEEIHGDEQSRYLECLIAKDIGGFTCTTNSVTFFMDYDNNIVRIVSRADIPTNLGIKRGDSIEKAVAAYGEDYTTEDLSGGDPNEGSYYIEYEQEDGNYLAFFFSYGKLSVWSIATQSQLFGEPAM